MTEGIFVPMEAVQVALFGALMVLSAFLLGMEVESDHTITEHLWICACSLLWWWFLLGAAVVST